MLLFVLGFAVFGVTLYIFYTNFLTSLSDLDLSLEEKDEEVVFSTPEPVLQIVNMTETDDGGLCVSFAYNKAWSEQFTSVTGQALNDESFSALFQKRMHEYITDAETKIRSGELFSGVRAHGEMSKADERD